MELENLFLKMITENLDDLRSGKLPKGKFVGKYIQMLNETDRENAFRFKRPYVIGEGKNPDNNWLDYILGLSEEEFIYFKQSLTTK